MRLFLSVCVRGDMKCSFYTKFCFVVIGACCRQMFLSTRGKQFFSIRFILFYFLFWHCFVDFGVCSSLASFVLLIISQLIRFIKYHFRGLKYCTGSNDCKGKLLRKKLKKTTECSCLEPQPVFQCQRQQQK